MGAPVVDINGLERVYTTQDASGDIELGWGLIKGERLKAGRWKDLSVVPASTGAKELCPMVAEVWTNPEEHAGKLYMPRTDSLSAFYAVNGGDSASQGMFDLLELLMRMCRLHNIRVLAEWTPRGQNFEPDTLSKFTHPHQHRTEALCNLSLPTLQM